MNWAIIGVKIHPDQPMNTACCLRARRHFLTSRLNACLSDLKQRDMTTNCFIKVPGSDDRSPRHVYSMKNAGRKLTVAIRPHCPVGWD